MGSEMCIRDSLYCARIVDVVHFIRDGGLSDNENNNEQTCSFVKI